MAKLFPNLAIIKKLNPPPTEGEFAIVNFLEKTLPDDYEIYFQPFINGDQPDIVLLNKNAGALIIEVKDWHLKHYTVDKEQWRVRHNNALIRSPLKQVKNYKNNLYNLHIQGLLEQKIQNRNLYGLIKTQVYFHNETQESLDRWTIDRSINTGENDSRHLSLVGNDSLNEKDYINILNRHYLGTTVGNNLFNASLYKKFVNVLQPPISTIDKGRALSKRQKELAVSVANKQQKILGVAGSGKTRVLAARTVQSHIRHQSRVLILSFNITLKNYIHDEISNVRDGLKWNNFFIMNYHNFIKIMANNLNIALEWDRNSELGANSWNDIDLFEHKKNDIIKYKSIFIDEIQDYESVWIQIIKKYFLAEDGEFVVFGDEKQNIYHRELDEDIRPNTTIPGAWSKLTESHRTSNKILPLINNFQKTFFTDVYDYDDIPPKAQQEFDFKPEHESINYIPFNQGQTVSALVELIQKTIEKNNFHQNDNCILGSTIELLRGIDLNIRSRNIKTMTTFETQETYDQIMQSPENEKFSHDDELEEVRRNKKYNFWGNPGTIKLSTIHSFKGWDIPNLFLILNPNEDNDELMYTALTRCKYNLFIIDIENEHYKDFFTSNIINESNKVQSSEKSSRQQSDGLSELDRGFNLFVEGMKLLGWNDDSKDAKKDEIDVTFNAMVDVMDSLGFGKELTEPNKESKNNKVTQKNAEVTLGSLEETSKASDSQILAKRLKPLLMQLKSGNKYKILILGQMQCTKKDLLNELTRFFNSHNVKQAEWDIDFRTKSKSEVINFDLKQLKKGQSSYSLVMTANWPTHNSKGNKTGSILTAMKGGRYIPKIHCNPTKKPSKEEILIKLEKYFLRETHKFFHES